MATEGDAQRHLDAIAACFGQDKADYVRNKQQGGRSGRKGTRYEDLFLTATVAEMAAVRLAAGTGDWPTVSSQRLGFVDDVVVAQEARTAYFQCKNAQHVSWTAGDYPIANDFAMQKVLAGHLGVKNPVTALVVAAQELANQLTATLPVHIEPHTEVHFFPYCAGSHTRLVLENPDLQESLQALAKVADAALDELIGVFAVLLTTCVEHANDCRIDQLLQLANRFHPAQIRRLPADFDEKATLDQRFVDVLEMIKGLQYSAPRGYFQWSAFGTRGVFGFPCTDKRFRSFQDEVIRNQPKTFEQLESYLP